MSRQQLAAGGYLDLLTKDELKETMGHSLDSSIMKWYRGIDYMSFVGNAQGLKTYTIPALPESGYTWSVKLVSATIGSNQHLQMFLGTTDVNNNPTSSAVGFAASDFELGNAIITFSSNALVIKDSSPITLITDATLGIQAWQLRVKQVPTEMQGKL